MQDPKAAIKELRRCFEVAIPVLRLAVAGTLDKHPHLKIVIGHQGEMMPIMKQRFDGTLDSKTTGFERGS